MKKESAYAALGLAGLAIIVWGIYAYTHKANQQTSTIQENNLQTSPAPTSTTPGSKAGLAKLSYGEAVKKYTNRFQFSDCHGNPGMMSVKKGQPVMLDNRDKIVHTIKVNGQTFKIAGYDYAVVYPAIVTVGEVTTASSNVTCDGGGAAVLNVEK